MQRVMIIGQPGSGKSTLARSLGAITHLPVVHIDHIHWKPGWVERDRDEKTRLCRAVHAGPQWIFEGGHSVTWQDRLEQADTLIWLDVGLTKRVARVVLRTLKDYGRTRPDVPANCPERFDAEFYAFIWRTRHSSRAKMKALVEGAPAEKDVHHLRSNGQVAEFLTDVARAMQAGALGLPHR
ncbi:MAG: AAA family ATPase [Paracoccaceae bacterium]|nr:AAA family ATPase [Paracoccaceae bacterium]